MKKILFIVGANLRACPYVFFYINALRNESCEIDIAYWDREKSPDPVISSNVKLLPFSKKSRIDKNIILKIFDFLAFRRFIIKVLKSNIYDKVIVFDTQFAVLFGNVLIKQFPDNFFFDYRDPSYEQFKFYRKKIDKIIRHSKCSFISSNGFRQLLIDSSKMYTIHNVDSLQPKSTSANLNIFTATPIRISFWGYVREFDNHKLFIDEIKNDSKYQVTFFGEIVGDGQKIQTYCKKEKIENVIFTGKYYPQDKENFIKQTDFILNLLGNKNDKLAMSNKFYDSLIFKIPMICNEDSFMGPIVSKYNLGITIDVNSSFKKLLNEYIDTFNRKNYETYSTQYLNYIEEENRLCVRKLVEGIFDENN